MQSMKMIQRTQRGFTLIELMIVVAIIGILAAIAIPQYQDYVTRSKWAGNITAVEPVKLAVAECIQQNAGVGTNCASAGSLGLTALPTPPYAAGAVTLTGAASNVTMNFTGSAEVGGYIYNAQGQTDASGTRFAWTAVGADNIPTKIIKGTGR